jgi:hypothetical protein
MTVCAASPEFFFRPLSQHLRFISPNQISENPPNQSNMTTPAETAPVTAAPAAGSPDYVDKGD